MAHEIRFGYALDKTLWAAVFKNDGGTFKVNITGGDTWEAWADANIATYDISLSEGAGGGTYTATFPVIAAGIYHVTVYEGSVAATDPPVGHGEMDWDGTAEVNNTAIKTYILSDVIGDDGDTLEVLSDQMDALSASSTATLNVYGEGE